MYLVGDLSALDGRMIVLHEDPSDGSEPKRHLVTVTGFEYLATPLEGFGITRIEWSDEEALPCPMLLADMSVKGNVVPATAGESFTDYFSVRGDGTLLDVVERDGPLNLVEGTRAPVFRYSPQLLKGTRYLWLQNPENMKAASRSRFELLRKTSLRVARAWSMKETARHLWHYRTRRTARRAWKHVIEWMTHSRLAPMVKVGQMLRTHLWGIVNAVVLRATNAHLESVNAKIQALKKRACGYRNRSRFRNSILFHTGGLDLYPMNVAHSNS